MTAKHIIVSSVCSLWGEMIMHLHYQMKSVIVKIFRCVKLGQPFQGVNKAKGHRPLTSEILEHKQPFLGIRR